MPGAAVEQRVEGRLALNAIHLKSAVLCADCDVVSDSPHDHCLVCGSRSLFNISRFFGGMLPGQRARVVDKSVLPPTLPAPVLRFRSSQRMPNRRRHRRLKPSPR